MRSHRTATGNDHNDAISSRYKYDNVNDNISRGKRINRDRTTTDEDGRDDEDEEETDDTADDGDALWRGLIVLTAIRLLVHIYNT